VVQRRVVGRGGSGGLDVHDLQVGVSVSVSVWMWVWLHDLQAYHIHQKNRVHSTKKCTNQKRRAKETH